MKLTSYSSPLTAATNADIEESADPETLLTVDVTGCKPHPLLNIRVPPDPTICWRLWKAHYYAAKKSLATTSCTNQPLPQTTYKVTAVYLPRAFSENHHTEI